MLLWLLALLPPAFYLLQLDSFGRLQYDDYYGIIPQMLDGSHFVSSPIRWLLLKSNEHSVTLPALVYALNVAASAGDNRVLSALAVMLLAGVAVVLWRALPCAFSGPRALRVAGPLLVSGLVLSPAGSYSVVMGFNGVMWFMSIGCSVLAIVLLRRAGESGSPGPLAAVVAAGWASALSFDTALFLWPALVAGAVLYRLPRRRLLVLCLAALATYTFVALTYVRPAGHPGLQGTKPWLLVEFAAVYLGSFLAASPWVAGALGVAGLAAAAFLAIPLLKGREDGGAGELVPWVMINVFAVGNAVGTALARAAQGGARSSRYAPLAALFWLSLVVIGCSLAWRAAQRRDPPRPVGVVAPVLFVLAPLLATWCRGLPIFAGWVGRAEWQGVAELALVHGIEDWEALEAVSVAPQEAFGQRGLLERLRHVPFERARPALSSPDAVPGSEGAAPCPALRARLTALLAVDGETVRVEGLLEGDSPRSELLVLDGSGRPRGVLRVLRPPALVARFGVPRDRSVLLAGYARPAAPGDPLRVFSRLPDAGGTPCSASEVWRASDRLPGRSGVGSWRRVLGLRQSAPQVSAPAAS
jgi:hypothetical protein